MSDAAVDVEYLVFVFLFVRLLQTFVLVICRQSEKAPTLEPMIKESFTSSICECSTVLMLVPLDGQEMHTDWYLFFFLLLLVRSFQAQTEVFIRACSAVESKLEHVVEELKKDRFLGDSDWPVVWR